MDLIEQLFAQAQADAAARKRSKAKGSGVAIANAELQAARENLYRPHRLVALFYRTTCAHCGTVEDAFDGLFEERKHVRVSDLHLVRQPFVPLNEGNLPRVRKYLPRDVAYCSACAGLGLYGEEE